MGGGEVDVKLGVPVVDFVLATNALVGNISEPRDLIADVDSNEP
jgi:hypothetical protein